MADTELVPAVMRAQEAAGNAVESTGVQLSRLIWMLEDPAEPLASDSRTPEQWHAEVFRRLIAFLNAAHDMQVYVRQMAGMCGEEPMQSPAAATRFLEEIRTCMQHRSSPPMRLVVCAPPAPRLRVLHMDLSAMMNWPHWSAGARQFLHQNQPEVEVAKLVHDYLQSLRMFRQRALRSFRARFAGILAACPAPVPMMMMPGMM